MEESTYNQKGSPMRGAIDRRFDGTPERRTRDYHLYDDSDDSYDGGRVRWVWWWRIWPWTSRLYYHVREGGRR